MSYTVGNWTVESQIVDSISTPKSLSIPDLDYADDFSVASHNSTEVRLANTSGTGLVSRETIRYRRLTEDNVYGGFDVPAPQRTNIRSGLVLTVEVKYLLKATNSVSGDELQLPMKGWLNLRVPTVDIVTTAALEDLLDRTVAAAFGTGSTDGGLVAAMARGDLDPTA